MKRNISLILGLSGLIGIVVAANGFCFSQTATAAGETQVAEKEVKHASVTLPIRRITREMENQVTNMIEGVLEGNFDYVKEAANGLSALGKKILDNFFPRGQWFGQVEAMNPAETKKRREDFNGFVNTMDSQIKEIQKAAESNDEEATLHAITNLVKKTCFECHKKYRS
jgi:cytochrome c556